MPNEPLDLDAIEARANAATPGPWERHGEMIYSRDDRSALWFLFKLISFQMTGADLTFVAAARTDIPALIARVREQEQEIARLRLDEHRLNWLDVHPRMVVIADRGEHGFQWAARDGDGACIWLGGLRQAIDRGREIEATVAAEAGR